MLGATVLDLRDVSAEEIEYLITDAGSKIAIVEQTYLAMMLEARAKLPELEHVIVIDGEAPQGTIALADVEGSNPEFDVAEAASGVEADDVLTLIYTSGTTGPPKGVQLSHHAIMVSAKAIEEIIRSRSAAA